MLDCKVDAVGCITPKKYKKYWLVDEHTNWTRPGAKTPLKLAVIQDFTSIYDQGVNYGLVAEDLAEKDALGMYILDPDQGG